MIDDPVDRLIERLRRTKVDNNRSVLDHLEFLVLRSESERLLDRLERIASGRFGVSDAGELVHILRVFAANTKIRAWSLMLVAPMPSIISDAVYAQTTRLLASLFAHDVPSGDGRICVVADAVLKPAEDRELLKIVQEAASRGVAVQIVESDGSSTGRAFELFLLSPRGQLVIAGGANTGLGAPWSVEVAPPAALRVEKQQGTPTGRGNVPVVALSRRDGVVTSIESGPNESAVSITDLFGEFICLRDLQPRSSRVQGLDALRSRLGLAPPFVPRKNERDYASVVRCFVNDLVGSDVRVIYVGDTVLNDGSVICNLNSELPGAVFGFLCNEKGFGAVDDLIIGPVYLSSRWRSLCRFVAEARQRGIHVDSRTVGLFDLDQTVYAAKGRDDEPLRDARWTAIMAFLQATIPSYRFNISRAEQIYRQFDQDEYHNVTRDNMDYVVLLVLAVAAGLCEASEIESFAASGDNSITALTEMLHQRALARRGHEEMGGVLDVIKAVHYNTLAGDQTPCKEFRRYECYETAARMRKSPGEDGRGRIVLNREVVDFIRYLRDRGAHVFAVSDRPVEAATLDEEDGAKEDLMGIPMTTSGFSIYDQLLQCR